MKYFVLMAALLIISAPATAQPGNFPGLDSFFTRLYQTNKNMGSIAIARAGTISYARAIGHRLYDKSQTLPANTATKYRIGSISKVFTAVIIFQLIEEEEIGLETRLGSYFPGFPNAATITIGNLLNHRSGIRNFVTIKAPGQPRTQEEMINMISKTAPRSEPGTKTLYSNANYLILGYIIEKILHKTYAAVLQERIISKLGLNNTYAGCHANSDNNESRCYAYENGWVEQPMIDLSIPGASGSILSTPTEMTVFIDALFTGKLISRSSLEKMKTITDDYGMGMVEFEFHTRKAYGQIGGIDYFESLVAYFPGDSVAVAFCTNGRAAALKDIVITAMNIYYGYSSSDPFFLVLEPSPKGLMKYVGRYSCTDLPGTVVVTKDSLGLLAIPEGATAYRLTPERRKRFSCGALHLLLDFDARGRGFILQQEKSKYVFVRAN